MAMLEYIQALKPEFESFVILPHEGNMQAVLNEYQIGCRVIYQYGWANAFATWNIIRWLKVITRSIIAILQLNNCVKRQKPVIICTNTLVPFIGSIVARLNQKPHVWWIHEFGREDFGFKTGWGFENLSLKWMQHASRLIIANSKAVAVKFQKKMPQANVQTIYQPVRVALDTATVYEKTARFLMFGQILPSKGHRDVLQAMIRNKEQGKPLYKLHIKGPCEMKTYLDELERTVRKNGLQDYVHIEEGYFKKETVFPFYEILIVASQAEAFGRVVVEANKAGLRVLVRNNGGAAELVNETNGLLFSNPEELAAALSGETIFPQEPIRLNYNEAEEITKLKNLLRSVCR